MTIKTRIAKLEKTSANMKHRLTEAEIQTSFETWAKLFDIEEYALAMKEQARMYPNPDTLRLARMLELVEIAKARRVEHEQP